MLEIPNDVVVYQRLPFLSVLFSPIAIMIVLLTFGVGIIIVWLLYLTSSEKIWLKDGRYYASSKKVSQEGCDIKNMQIIERNVGLGSLVLNKVLLLYPLDSVTKKPLIQIPINRYMYGKETYAQIVRDVYQVKNK
jgi:hypothetical protein